MQAIILAGGKGTRLKPITMSLPKPLVPIGEMPILEVVIRQLKHFGFTDITLAVNHLAELLMAFFGNGSKWGVNVDYSMEDEPLGTAAPLRLIENLQEDFIVMNGDLLTTIDFAHLMEYHRSNGNAVTIATYQKEVKIDLGVLETDGDRFVDYIEKPTYHFSVSMGIYAMNRKVLSYIPEGKRYDMPELMLKLRDAGEKVGCYSGDYYWLDIGRLDDYETAVEMFQERKSEFLY